MRLEENWAIDGDRIRAFFREQADVHEEDGCFRCRSCIIMLSDRQDRLMGKWMLPRTQLCFEGDDADVQDIHRRFFLRFLSAGG